LNTKAAARSAARRPGAASHAGLALVLLALLSGCATPPPASDPEAVAEYNDNNDPAEPTNRALYKVHDALDTTVMRPVAAGYRAVVPGPVRTGIHNALLNLGSAVRLGNDMAQGSPRRAGDTLMRALINSTVGVLGLFDVATDWGYPLHETGFGDTLALWGVPDGPYLFVPGLGPRNARDLGGFLVNATAEPVYWIGQGVAVTAARWSVTGVYAVDQRYHLLDAIDSVKKSSLDPYATFRSAYQQRRAAEIRAIRDDKGATVPVWFPQSLPAQR